MIPYLRTENLKNHTLSRGTYPYLYSPIYKSTQPPWGIGTVYRHLFNNKRVEVVIRQSGYCEILLKSVFWIILFWIVSAIHVQGRHGKRACPMQMKQIMRKKTLTAKNTCVLSPSPLPEVKPNSTIYTR